MILGYHVSKTYDFKDNRKTSLYIFLGLILFSMNQYETWYEGICVHWYMNTFFSILGFYIMSKIERDNYRRLMAVFLCGVLALFSYGNGLIYWPVVVAILFVKR